VLVSQVIRSNHVFFGRDRATLNHEREVKSFASRGVKRHWPAKLRHDHAARER